jgi:hypothetical protein
MLQFRPKRIDPQQRLQNQIFKLRESIERQKEEIFIKAVEEYLGIKIDIEAQKRKRFKDINVESSGKQFNNKEYEHWYWNDGSEEGLCIVTFETDYGFREVEELQKPTMGVTLQHQVHAVKDVTLKDEDYENVANDIKSRFEENPIIENYGLPSKYNRKFESRNNEENQNREDDNNGD